MEVHGRQHDDAQDRLQRSNRDRIRSARRIAEELSAARGDAVKRARAELASATRDDGPSAEGAHRHEDVIELSLAADAAGGRPVEVDTVDMGREERVAALERAHRDGTLHSPERLERAAERILLG